MSAPTPIYFPPATLPAGWPLVIPPNGILSFQWNWLRWLSGDTVTASTFTVSGPQAAVNASVTVESNGFTATSTIMTLSAGAVLGYCLITNSITTAAGLAMNWTATLTIENT